MALDADWHKKNKMVKNPTEKQRLEWHIKHIDNCSCRTPSPKLAEEIKKFLKN